MLKRILKDVIVLIWIPVLLFITQDIKTFYLISFDNLYAIGNSSQYHHCRLHTNCFLTCFPFVSFFSVNHLIYDFYDPDFGSISSYFVFSFFVLTSILWCILNISSLILLSCIKLCLKSLIIKMPLGLRATFHPGQHAEGISLYYPLMYAISECALCLGLSQNCVPSLKTTDLL